MKRIPLLSELLEAGEDHKSQASQDAKRLGLTYMQFGRYGQNGKVTHTSVDGKLVPVDQHKANMKQMGGQKPQVAQPRQTGGANAIARKNPAYGKNVAGDAGGKPLATGPAGSDPFDPYAGDLSTSANPNVNKMGSMTPPKPPAPPATPTRSAYGDVPADAAPQGRQQAPSNQHTIPKLGDLTPSSDDPLSPSYDPATRKAKLAGYQKTFAPQAPFSGENPAIPKTSVTPNDAPSNAQSIIQKAQQGQADLDAKVNAWRQANKATTSHIGGNDSFPRADATRGDPNEPDSIANAPKYNPNGAPNNYSDTLDKIRKGEIDDPGDEALLKMYHDDDEARLNNIAAKYGKQRDPKTNKLSNIAPLPQEPNVNKLSSMTPAPVDNFEKGDNVDFTDRQGKQSSGTVIHKHDDNGEHAGHYNIKRHTSKPEYPHTVHGSQMKRREQPDAERFSADKEAENDADTNPSLYRPDQ